MAQAAARLQKLQQDLGAQLVFAGSVEVGERSRVHELLRFPSIDAWDACVKAGTFSQHEWDRRASVQLLQPVAILPWQ